MDRKNIPEGNTASTLCNPCPYDYDCKTCNLLSSMLAKKDAEESAQETEEEEKDSLEKLGDDYGLTPEGVRHAIEAYQDIICEITGGKLSKLTYNSHYVLEEAEEYYKWKYGVEEENV